MKILHYFLGFPPFRSGGMTKFAMDLMQFQNQGGDEVVALWPGKMGFLDNRISIRERKPIEGLRNYELLNPLPVPLDEGIADVERFVKPCDRDVYTAFLKREQPDVIHIHTLMGLHRAFLDAAADLGIRTVFTSHDFFGICPKVTLFHSGRICTDDHNCSDCVRCNKSALSINKIKLLQSPLYRGIKKAPIVAFLRKKHRSVFFERNQTVLAESNVPVEDGSEYRKLRSFYMDMLSRIDVIHFNSSVSEAVYKKYLNPKHSVRINISHSGIQDNRSAFTWEPGEKLRLTTLSPAKPYKGFDVIQKGLDMLWNAGKRDFELKVFSPVSNPSPYMIVQEEGFQSSELENILRETDILLAPSACYETFGFTVLEALSYGVPVIVSDTVGSKDIILDGTGIILKDISAERFADVICELRWEQIIDMRKAIRERIEIQQVAAACEAIAQCCYYKT